jgi:hypothetical protein
VVWFGSNSPLSARREASLVWGGGGRAYSEFISVCGNTVEKKNKMKVLNTLMVSTGNGILNSTKKKPLKTIQVFFGRKL